VAEKVSRVFLASVETCGCKDYQRREEACKHVYAVSIYNARGCRRCSKIIRHY